MKGLFLDAVDDLASVFHRVSRPGDPPMVVHEHGEISPEELPGLLAGYDFCFDDHTQMPTEAMRGCSGLKHVIFLGTGARSYMNPEELSGLGITVHTIKGYGDTAVAEHAIALMWAAARGLARMDGGMRAGNWFRTEGMELTGKTLGLVGFGGIAAEVARIAGGSGMRVLAWNRTPKTAPGVTFVDLDTLAGGEPGAVGAPAAERRDARVPERRTAAADAAGRDPGEHGAGGDRGRGGDDRGAAVRAAAACGAGCVRGRAAAGRTCADDAAAM